MDVKEAVLAGLKELIVPELQVMKQAQAELKTTLGLTNKRLDDINSHLIDQSRRIDETNKRIDSIHADLITRIDKVNADLVTRIDKVNMDLIMRNDETNRGLARLYEVIVRREEHQFLAERVARLEQSLEELKRRQAA
ncbi:MAG: hypothetical protein COS90_11915 [Deltaproteobacteria bacterium CG07_land_8_20_14_0_80_60_11]|nr:MAG: hypothetical protein COS90_11915 [Deltaproteobacteria bacterium CG07_land_8_20_14_0_80_60_11]